MGAANKNQLVTIADLDDFKTEIISSMKALFKNAQGPKKWLKTSEVRKLINVSPGKLQTMRDSGLLAYTKIGGNIYYDPDDVYQMFEGNKTRKNLN